MKKGNWYKFRDAFGSTNIGQYMGTCKGVRCCVCEKGSKAHTFNVWYNENEYETWGYGKEHLPQIIEDLGTSETVIVDC